MGLIKWCLASARLVRSRSTTRSSMSRIGLTSLSIRDPSVDPVVSRRDFNEKGRALARRTLSPYPAAHPFDDLSGYRQPQSRALIFLIVVQAPEYLEYILTVLHIEAHAVVSNPDTPGVVVMPGAYFNA